MVGETVKLTTTHFDTKNLEIGSFRLVEAIGRPFEITADVVVLGEDHLELDQVVGAEVTFTLDDGARVREIHGLVVGVQDHLDTEVAFRNYRLEVRPLAHRLALVETVDIFLELSIPEVVKRKLSLVGDEERFASRLRGDYPKRDFVVQYKETDLAFVSRLAEHIGVSLVFADDGSLALVDQNTGFDAIDGDLAFRARGEEVDVFALSAKRNILPSLYVVRDYNYRIPQTDVAGSHDLPNAYAGGVIEYGPHAKTPEDAAQFAKIRAEERQAARHVLSGRSSLIQIAAAKRGRITGHTAAGDLEVLFTSVTHVLEQGTSVSSPDAKKASYRNTFEAILADVPFRPARTTPRPFVPGLLTGVVDADDGRPDIANIDDQGRYRIRLLFDTAAAGERPASHRIRMAQPHSGAGYGMHFPLNPGVEVLLSFVNGDPDRPIIVGSVPNPVTPSPVDASAQRLNRIKTESGVLLEIGDNV